MDGRVFTPEDEIDVLHEDLRKARAALDRLMRSCHDGRFVGDAIDYEDRLSAANRRVQVLERELAEAIADQIAAAEGHQ